VRLSTFLAFVALSFLVVFTVNRGRTSLDATLPKDMPGDARFVRTGYDLATNEYVGLWVACMPNLEEQTNLCRVTNQRGDVIFQGQFLPVDTQQPVPAAQLKIGTLDKDNLWTDGPAESAPVPVIPLADGQRLVPVIDRAAILDRWAANPAESRKYMLPGG